MSDPQQPQQDRPDPPPPAAEPAAAPGPPAAAAEPVAAHPVPVAPPAKRAVIGRVVGHRATQLVAVGLLGLVLGGGIVALLDRDHDRDHRRYGVGADRPGHSRFDERGDRRERGSDRLPDRGPARDFER